MRHDYELEPPPSGRPIVLALAILLVLTFVSWAVSQLEHTSASTPIAIAIAMIKASVVAVAFMELPRASLVARVVAVVTLSFIALLCGGTIADVLTR